MIIFRFWMLIFSSTGFCSNALSQERLPTDVELRSAYCIPVLQNDISVLQQALATANSGIDHITDIPVQSGRDAVLQAYQRGQREFEKAITERQSALNRLQLYITPKIPYLDVDSLMAATSRAKADIQQFDTKSKSCTLECMGPLKSDSAEKSDPVFCFKTCSGVELNDRLAACRNPTWLPF